MAKIDLSRAGQSVSFTFDNGTDSTDNWTCAIFVKQYPADTAAITRVIPLDADDKWTGFLTQTETSALAIGLWYLTAKLSNTVTDEEKQISQGSVRFNNAGAWA